MAAPNMLWALTYWDLISTMCVLTLVIPNFSRSTTEANFSTPDNLVLSVVALGMYHLPDRPDRSLSQSLHRARAWWSSLTKTAKRWKPETASCRFGRQPHLWWWVSWWYA